jgi:hypothetical protein
MQSPFIRDMVEDYTRSLVLLEELHSSVVHVNRLLVLFEGLRSKCTLAVERLILPTEGRAQKSMSTFANITEELAFYALQVRVTKLVIRSYELLLKRNPIYRLFKNKVHEEYVELQFMCPNDKFMQQISMEMKHFAFITSFERFFV